MRVFYEQDLRTPPHLASISENWLELAGQSLFYCVGRRPRLAHSLIP